MHATTRHLGITQRALSSASLWQWPPCRPWWNLLSSCKHGSNLLSFSKIQPVKTVSTIRGWISNSFTLVMVPERTPHVQDRHNWSQPINNKKASDKKVNNWTPTSTNEQSYIHDRQALVWPYTGDRCCFINSSHPIQKPWNMFDLIENLCVTIRLEGIKIHN